MEERLMFSYLEKKEAQGDSKKPIFYFKITDAVVDRVKDLVIPEGIDYTNYEKNPVILFAHQGKKLPVGKAVEIDKENAIIGVEFADTPEAKNIEYLVENGYLNAVSIGFIGKEAYCNYCQKDLTQLQKDYPVYWEKYKNEIAKADRVFTKIELVEVSIVPVPANPNALLVMVSKGLDTVCTMSECKGEIKLTELNIKEAIELAEKAYVPYSVHKGMEMLKDEKSSWDKTYAVESLRKWASKDGSGSKDTIDWRKYRKGFTWYDKEKIDNFTSYKYPHHWVKDGKFYVVRRGVITAMAYFFKYYKNLPAEDRMGVYKHLAEHYKKDFDMTPPKFEEGKDYSIVTFIKDAQPDTETLIEFVKLFEADEITKEISELVKEVDGYQAKVAELESQVKELQSKLVEVENKSQSIENNNADSTTTIDKSADSPSKKEEDVESVEEKVVVDDAILQQLPTLIEHSIKKILEGGK